VKRSTRVAAVLAAALLLASCEFDRASKEHVHVWCHGTDRIYAMNDGSYGSGLFVVPNHQECTGAQQ